MPLNPEQCYEAKTGRNPDEDGKFFIGIKTVGVYCRPVCRGRAKFENCSFYQSAAAAEAAGFRPCLHCRPEAAPEKGDAHELAAKAKTLIKKGDCTDPDALAKKLKVTKSQLRQCVETTFGANLEDFIATEKLLAAKRLISDSKASLGEIASSTGFKSARDLSSAFVKRYGFTPTQVRTRTTGKSRKR